MMYNSVLLRALVGPKECAGSVYWQVAAASGLQYPRKKLLIIIAVFRYIRFSGEGVLGMLFGRQIVRLGGTRLAEVAIVILLVIAAGGSAVSVLRWLKTRKSAPVKNS